jgi:hypothetical protein
MSSDISSLATGHWLPVPADMFKHDSLSYDIFITGEFAGYRVREHDPATGDISSPVIA